MVSTDARTDLTGRRVSLEPLRDRHLPALHAIATDERAIAGWPCYGRALSIGEFRRSVWQLGGLQFAVRRRDGGAIIGLVQGLDPDIGEGVVDLAFFVRPDLWLSGWPFEAIVIALDHLFDEWEFRRVYLRARASDAATLGLTERWATEEARLVGHHVNPAGDAEDVVVLTMACDEWDHQLAMRILGRPSDAPVIASSPRTHMT